MHSSAANQLPVMTDHSILQQYGKHIVAIFNTIIQVQFNEIQVQFNEIQVQFNENSRSIENYRLCLQVIDIRFTVMCALLCPIKH